MTRHRVRLRLEKGEEVRFISHLDLARALERAVRRAGLPVALSEGFHPMPKLALGPPLALGATSRAEYLDLELREPVPAQEVANRVQAVLPPGLKVLEAGVPPAEAKALMAECAAADYLVRVVPAGGDEWNGARAAAELLAKPEWVVMRAGKDGDKRRVDIRPHLLALTYQGPESGGPLFAMRVRTGSTGGARPEEYLPALGRFARTEVERTEVWLARNGELVRPL